MNSGVSQENDHVVRAVQAVLEFFALRTEQADAGQ